MKQLSLYVDKWYIVGAINIDGNTRPLHFPNREDRIWLYFHEDVANDEISYSKDFQRNYRDKEIHYYGDVFSQITSSSAKYIMFKRQQDMIGIFKSARIFDDIRRDIEEDDEIETFLSFSKDIKLAARMMFMDVLAKEKFVVKESVARIEHLALEYSTKRGSISNDGYYLVLNASNENLHFSIYQKSKDLFVRISENCINGLGTDVRSRALIEQLVDTINIREHLLKNKDEQETEYLRMTQFVDDWIVKLSTARSAMPIQISGITFSIDPHRDYSVSVQRSKIDQRTARIVEDIVKAITNFVKDSNIHHEQVAGIIFLGNTFTNQQFKNEFQKYYNVSSSAIIPYRDTDLSSLVNVYTQIDCKQFSAETSSLLTSAEAELQRQRIAEEEALAKQKAQDEAKAIESKRIAESEAERKYGEAIQKGYDSEANHDYDAMAEYFNIALSYRPNDKEASDKYNDALRKKAEFTVRTNNYKDRIQQAKTAFDNGDWETAKQKSEEALGFMSDSKEAGRIKEESLRKIKQGKDFDRYLDRADLFIAQKVYDEALKELDKAKLLDINSTEKTQIKEREIRISKERGAIEKQISELSQKVNFSFAGNRFEEAISYCNKLVEIDFANSRKWTAKIGEIKSRQEEQKKEESLLKSLLASIESAQWNEDWIKLADLCRQALEIKEDENLRSKLRRAESKISEKETLLKLEKEIGDIKDLILSKQFKNANQLLSKLEKSSLNSEYKAKVRELRTLLFNKEDEAESEKTKTKNNNHEGFFGKSDTKKQPSNPVKKSPQQPDDFFDKKDTINNNDKKKAKAFTNDDFFNS